MVPPAENEGHYNRKPDAAIRLALTAEHAGRRLDVALALALPDYSRNRLKVWIEEGRVSVNGEAVLQPRRMVLGGEEVAIAPAAAPEESAYRPEALALTIVYEDEHLLVIDKPVGLVVHPGSGNWSGTLLNALLHHASHLAEVPRAGIVHRLDKDTSGLMVVAKTIPAQVALVRQLKARTVSRTYRALAQGRPARKGTVDAPIGRHPRHRTRMAVVASGKPAVTHYRVLRRFDACLPVVSAVECALETGRTHQIRVHLSSLGHPLLGDTIYGGRPSVLCAGEEFPVARQMLHAWRLELDHPASGERLAWEAAPPEDMAVLMECLQACGSLERKEEP